MCNRKMVKTSKKTATERVKSTNTGSRAGKKLGPQGTEQTRAQVDRIGQAIMALASGKTIRAAADDAGLAYFDIKNLRAGNHASLNMVIKLITKGGFTPDSILSGEGLKPLRGRGKSRVKGLTKPMIAGHIRTLSSSRPAKEWAVRTGLTPASIYQLRKDRQQISLHTVLAFINGGAKSKEIFKVD